MPYATCKQLPITSTDSSAYARAVVKRVVGITRNLSKFPNSGRIVPEFQDTQIRELLVYSYRIIYLIEQEHVLIATVIHGKRELS